MIQYYSVNIPQIGLVCDTRKVTVETILKQLECVTKGHIATQTAKTFVIFYSIMNLSPQIMALSIGNISLQASSTWVF